ncbi:MAG TPA: DNA polymerase III subunit gamma/tau [Candidatus Binatia bacterium]|nr:DNA polymerase III subunit gamma/tau [Candidatus Binatia bacterium]
MSYQVLARKYRPQKFSEVIGQEHVTRTLRNAIEQGRVAHGYIFSGHRGIGKTTIARILAMALNCRSHDHPVPEPCGVCDSCREIRAGSVGSMNVIEIDAATNRGIDEIRRITSEAIIPPAAGARYRIFILDEAHQVTEAAFNALLKTLEEPPPWIVFMLATTQPEDLPQTIRSRCQHFSFHAVRFDDIVAQLRGIAKQEGIQADDNALAMLAEVGDGSMRDALSIMDQAIACCGTTLSVDVVRGLVGTVPSQVLEDVMDAVARNCSQDVLRTLDRLLVEGQSPQHFARQMLRFLRNVLMARVAGSDSPVLQISADERARVARVAERFSEEDLSRFLQIMLRTHGELGYRQEQRFHLELGLLKLVHAQRLLPLEELLSGEAGRAESGAASPVRAAGGTAKQGAPAGQGSAASRYRETEPASSRAPAESPFARPSPFEADRSRKSGPKAEAQPQSSPVAHASPSDNRSNPGRMSSNAETTGSSTGTAVAVEADPADVPIEVVRNAVLAALENAGQHVLAHNLEAGEWVVTGGELSVRVAMSQVLIDVALGPEARRIIQAAISQSANKPLQFRMTSSGAAAPAKPEAAPRPSNGAGARSRAMADPVVQRMQEKFGAEIRTVIDQKVRG